MSGARKEADVMGRVVRSSGGGDPFEVRGDPNMLYKKVKCADEMQILHALLEVTPNKIETAI